MSGGGVVIGRAPEIVQTTAAQDLDDIWHAVCHCTDDRIAACGLDCSDAPWCDDGDDKVCPLCILAWPDDAPTCPWGCDCEDDCGPP